MPQVEVHVSDFDIVSDLSNYYRNTVLTYSGKPAFIHAIGRNDNGVVTASIRTLGPTSDDWGRMQSVPWDEVGVLLPRLGYVKSGERWAYLSRNPQRKMRKGYSPELIRSCPVPHQAQEFNPVDVFSSNILRQLWYGNSERIHPDVCIVDGRIYYEQDEVATIDDQGNLNLTEGREKIGGFVCKLLGNNWDILSQRYSIRHLPS